MLADDNLGEPAATISWFDLAQGCVGLSFDSDTGILSGTPGTLVFCTLEYAISNASGSSRAFEIIL